MMSVALGVTYVLPGQSPGGRLENAWDALVQIGNSGTIMYAQRLLSPCARSALLGWLQPHLRLPYLIGAFGSVALVFNTLFVAVLNYFGIAVTGSMGATSRTVRQFRFQLLESLF